MTRVFRIQDAEGRGPWRPGLSAKWADKDWHAEVEDLPPFFEEFGHDLIQRRGLPGEHWGCAVRKLRDLRRWLSPTERRKLSGMGFTVVSIKPDRILAESKNQLVIASRVPFRRAPVSIIPWEEVDSAQ